MMPRNSDKTTKSGTTASINDQLKKATTEMLVLFVLRQKPMYTYEMMNTIERLSEGRLSFNTLYQAIYRLRDFGYISESDKVLSEDNRIRIYFSITEAGEGYLRDLRVEYQNFIDTISLIFSRVARRSALASSRTEYT